MCKHSYASYHSMLLTSTCTDRCAEPAPVSLYMWVGRSVCVCVVLAVCVCVTSYEAWRTGGEGDACLLLFPPRELKCRQREQQKTKRLSKRLQT